MYPNLDNIFLGLEGATFMKFRLDEVIQFMFYLIPAAPPSYKPKLCQLQNFTFL
jgi:hypothetical protein